MRISVWNKAGAPKVWVPRGGRSSFRLHENFLLTVDPEDGSPQLSLHFEVRDGVPQCRRAEVVSTDAGREVLSSDLRNVKVADLLETAVSQAALVNLYEGTGVPDPVSGATMTKFSEVPPQSEEQRRRIVSQTRKARKESRRRVTAELLAEVARVYRENVDGNPTMAVAEFTGRAHRTAALYIKQAREAGLLGAASPGKKGER